MTTNKDPKLMMISRIKFRKSEISFKRSEMTAKKENEARAAMKTENH
jgi:hypothetical protein